MRLKSHIWVSAYLRRLDQAFIQAMITHRGDPDAGAIYIKLSQHDGSCQVLAPIPAVSAHPADALVLEEGRAWQAVYPAPVEEGEANAYLERRAARNPDIWILDVEASEGRHLLGEAPRDKRAAVYGARHAQGQPAKRLAAGA